MDCDRLWQRVNTVLLYRAALLLIFFQAVSSQSVRNGFIGGDVLLPCIYPGRLPDPVSVIWRDKDDRVVLDIINGTPNKMDPKFKGRVFSYPDQYKKGNLSILIRDLRADDAGSYDCHILRVDYDNLFSVNLSLTEKPAVKQTSPRHVPSPTPAPSDAVVPSSLHLALLLVLFVLFVLFVLCILVYFCTRRCRAQTQLQLCPGLSLSLV